eukprot:768717-Hanusia_phi.AAC.6
MQTSFRKLLIVAICFQVDAFLPSSTSPLQISRLSIQPLHSIPWRQDKVSITARSVGRKCRAISSMSMKDAAVAGEASTGDGQQSEVFFRNLPALVHKVQRLADPFWGGESKSKAWLWTAFTLSLAFITTLYAVSISFIQKFFWNALNAKDLAKFNKFLALYLAVLTLGPPLLVLFDWAKGRMALSWRNALTNLYLDNTDQRISEDINNFCDKAVALFCTSVVAVCDLVVFSVILYKIFPPLYFTLVAYAVFGTFVTVWFGKPLIKKNRMQLKKEADFRFDLVRIREDAESVAFYNGETRERTEAQNRFKSVVANRIGILNFERNLNFFTRWYRYLVQVLPALVIGPQYFAGKVPLGAISQTFFSFNHVLNDLSLVTTCKCILELTFLQKIVNEFTGPQGISSFAAQVERLDQLRTAVEKVQ